MYVTNSLYAAWDEVFCPDGVGAWMAKFDADVSGAVLSPTSDSSPTARISRGLRVRQTRLQGGDASRDSYRYSS